MQTACPGTSRLRTRKEQSLRWFSGYGYVLTSLLAGSPSVALLPPSPTECSWWLCEPPRVCSTRMSFVPYEALQSDSWSHQQMAVRSLLWFIYFYFKCMSAWVCVPRACSVHRGLKRAPDPWNWVTAGHEPWVHRIEPRSCESTQCCNCGAISLALAFSFLR